MLNYLTIPTGDEWTIKDENNIATAHLVGDPPYIVWGLTTSPYHPDWFYGFYISSSSPTTRRALFHLFVMQNSVVDQDLMIEYDSDPDCTAKNFTNIMLFYNQRLKDAVESLLNTLDWDKVKIDQQDQFFRGIRLAKQAPLLGFKVCLDAYNFDPFEVDWSNPATYFNGVKNILGLAKVVSIV